ncbi:MAG: hypothetical protein KGN84_13120 [Acidobacteriota bacterium]|nr:hypothetical protein [Acidobacteriota bacterium]
MRFAARYDRATMIVTPLVILFLILIGAFTQPLVVGVIGGVGLLIAYGSSARYYEVSGGKLIVRRLFGNLVIDAADIRQLRAATPEDMSGLMRVMGSGAFFGYFGTFRTTKLGICTWYVTDRAKCVVVATSADTYVISPDDREGFLAALSPLVSQSEHSPAANSPQAALKARKAKRVLIAVILGCVVLGLLFAAIYSPGPPAYTLTSNSLEIHDHLYPVTLKRGQVDIWNVRVIDLGRDADWKPLVRLNGFGNRTYRAGWFRLANKKTVRMYAGFEARVVLLPGENGGPTVLLEVSDPASFISQLRAKWGY